MSDFEYSYTLIFRHDNHPSVKITIDVESDDSPEYLREHPLALDLLEAADDFIESAELSMYDYTLVAVMRDSETVLRYDDGSVDLTNTVKNDEDRDNR
jgi:hypothetical protein